MPRRTFASNNASLQKVIAWAEQAAPPDPDALLQQRILTDLDDDRRGKVRQIQALELEIAASLAAHAVRAADGDTGHQRCLRRRTGRRNGTHLPLCQRQRDHRPAPACSPAVTKATPSIARAISFAPPTSGSAPPCCASPTTCSASTATSKANAPWTSKRVDPRLQRTRVVKRFSRLAYAMVAGQQIIAHPCCRLPGYVLDKLVMFHLEHAAPAETLVAALDAAAGQLPRAARDGETEGLQQRIAHFDGAQAGPEVARRARSPKCWSNASAFTYNRLPRLRSQPTATGNEPTSPSSPWRLTPLSKTGALSRSPCLIRRFGAFASHVPVWQSGDAHPPTEMLNSRLASLT